MILRQSVPSEFSYCVVIGGIGCRNIYDSDRTQLQRKPAEYSCSVVRSTERIPR